MWTNVTVTGSPLTPSVKVARRMIGARDVVRELVLRRTIGLMADVIERPILRRKTTSVAIELDSPKSVTTIEAKIFRPLIVAVMWTIAPIRASLLHVMTRADHKRLSRRGMTCDRGNLPIPVESCEGLRGDEKVEC